MSVMVSKVVRFHKIGDASVLKIENLPIEEPGADEVRIKVNAIGLNRAEVMFRNGAYLEVPQLPSRLGYEAAGMVETVGANVSGFNVGDRVSTIPAFSMGQFGVYGEHAIVPAHAVAKSPDGYTEEQSAAIWMQYITAYGALIDIGNLQRGEQVLITAASSSVGIAAIHIAKCQGAQVIATTRSGSKKKFLYEQGADHVIQTDSDDIIKTIADLTNGLGVKLIFDPIGGPNLSSLAEVSAQSGRIIEYGALDNNPTPFPLFPALAKGLVIQGYTIFEITKDKDRLNRAKEYLLALFNEGIISPLIDKVFTFDQIQQAHEYMESNQQIGKIVVSV